MGAEGSRPHQHEREHGLQGSGVAQQPGLCLTSSPVEINVSRLLSKVAAALSTPR